MAEAEHTTAIRRTPLCGVQLTVGGIKVACGLPQGHLPPEDHEHVIRWSTRGAPPPKRIRRGER